MRLFQALSHQQVRALWLGQVFSAVGDEVYNIAVVWYAASVMGTGAGYLSALQAGSIFVLSLIGGVWADHRDNRKVMIFSDVVRGLGVLSLPLFAHFDLLSLWTLVPVVVLVSSLSAFFQPALSALLPNIVKDRAVLQASNGLMETTSRIARVIGPGFVGAISSILPLIHYFTIDALSFFASALSVLSVRSDAHHRVDTATRLGLREVLTSGHRLVRSQAIITFTIFSGIFAATTWIFIMPLGMTLLLRDRFSSEVSSLSFLVAAYGVGNILSNILISSFEFSRPERWMFAGRLIAGCGFFAMAFSPSLVWMMAFAAFSATGGPMTDLGFVNLIQKYFSGKDVARVFRYAMALANGALLLVYAVSPKLFQLFSVTQVIAANALVLALSGIAGFTLAYRVREDSQA